MFGKQESKFHLELYLTQELREKLFLVYEHFKLRSSMSFEEFVIKNIEDSINDSIGSIN